MYELETYLEKIDPENVPRHVAIIMDGNGRWAQSKGLPRIAGHREGIKSIKRISEVGGKVDLEVLTLFAFSTENWKRPRQEVEFLMSLPQEYLKKELDNLNRNNIKVSIMGEIENLPINTQQVINEGVKATANNTSMILNFAINYGGRQEIVDVCKKLAERASNGEIEIEEINGDLVKQSLYKPELPDPDLLIRSGGEQRISNFLLWQLAYTEFWFSEVLWPDFQKEHFLQAILDYQQRKRKFGKV